MWYNTDIFEPRTAAMLEAPGGLMTTFREAVMPADFTTKRCTKCGVEYPNTHEFFGVSKKGLRADCKHCVSARAKAYRDTHIDELKEKRKKRRAEYGDIVLENARRFYRRHAEEIKLKRKQDRIENPEKHKAYERARYIKRKHENSNKLLQYKRKSYLKNREKRLAQYREYRNRDYVKKRMFEYQRQWTKENHDKKLAYGRKWRHANPDKQQKFSREWFAANPDKVRIYAHSRRARVAALPATMTLEQWGRALEYFHGGCAYCEHGPSLFDVNWTLHQDHFIPLTSGGHYTALNIIPACQSCNVSKHNRDPREWLTAHFGPRRAKAILARIEAYFAWVAEQDKDKT